MRALRDLRRTGTTLTGMFGVRPDVIEKCLNHIQQNGQIRTYQRQDLTAEQNDAAMALSRFTAELPKLHKQVCG